MPGLSQDPERQAAQLANLRPGGNTVQGPARRGGVPKGTPRTGRIPKGYKIARVVSCTCRLCGVTFQAANANGAWCSKGCKQEAYRLIAILEGRPSRGREYPSVADRFAASYSRTGALTRMLQRVKRIRSTRDPLVRPWGYEPAED